MSHPRTQFESMWPHGRVAENEGRFDEEAALLAKFEKVAHPSFAQGMDRVVAHIESGRFFRCRIEVTASDRACKHCKSEHIHEGAPILAPLKITIIECTEEGEMLHDDDGNLKVVGAFSHAIASANMAYADHWRGIKRMIRNTMLEHVQAMFIHEQMFAENFGDGVTSETLRRNAVAHPPGNGELARENARLRQMLGIYEVGENPLPPNPATQEGAPA